MTNLLKTVLSMSLSGTILIMTFFLFKPLWKDRLSKQWQYYIWLIVLARLLLPFALEANLMSTFFQKLEKDTTQTEQITWEASEIPVESKQQDSAFYTITTESFSPTAKVSESTCLFLIWFIVALVLFIRKVVIYQNFSYYVKIGQTPVEDIKILNHFGTLLSEANIKRKIELAVNPLISSPMLMGVFHPCIVLPDNIPEDRDFYYTVRHEIIHYKRCDLFYKWLVQITLCLHWFNPFVYGMVREINRSCELSCDEAVIFNRNTEEKIAYGDTLVNAMGRSENYKNPSASVTLSENTQLLKERLDSIMKFRKKSKITLIATLALTLLYSIAAITIGAYATPNKTKTALQQEYAKWEIEKIGDSYYYKKKPIRIL